MYVGRMPLLSVARVGGKPPEGREMLLREGKHAGESKHRVGASLGSGASIG